MQRPTSNNQSQRIWLVEGKHTITLEFIQIVFCRASGHLWWPIVLAEEKNRQQSSQTHSHTRPCWVTSWRSRSCLREKCSLQPISHGYDVRSFALWDLVWTSRVYWFVNLRLQLGFGQRYRRGLKVPWSSALTKISWPSDGVISWNCGSAVLGDREDREDPEGECCNGLRSLLCFSGRFRSSPGHKAVWATSAKLSEEPETEPLLV